LAIINISADLRTWKQQIFGAVSG